MRIYAINLRLRWLSEIEIAEALDEVTMVGAGLAIAYVLLVVLLMLLARIDLREFVGPLTLAPALAVILASLLAGFLTDYFQPAQGSRAAR